MNKGKSASRKSKTKRKAAPKSVDEYLASAPLPVRSALHQMRAAIRSALPADTTEVISYGIPAFKHKKVLVWFAGFTNHCSLFPTASIIEAQKDELRAFTISKGTIQFPLDKPIPTALVQKLVKARVAESQSKGKR